MKQRNLLVLIVISTIALLGLIAIQSFLIGNAIALKETSFQREANSAIQNVVAKFDRISQAQKIKGQIKSSLLQGFNMQNIDSASFLILKELETIPWDKYITDSMLNANLWKLNIFITTNKNGKLVKQLDTKQASFLDRVTNAKFRPGISIDPDIPKDKKEELLKKLETVLHKSINVKQLFPEIFKTESISHRKKDKIIIDSLLRTELKQRGIDIDYNFGIYSSSIKDFVCISEEKVYKDLIENGLVYALYSIYKPVSSDFLLVTFPEKRKYVQNQIIGLLLLSGLLVLALIGIFAYFFHTIIQQKKLSELKNDFINNMTHEFKTPISTISLTCEVLNDENMQISVEQHKNYINIISQENHRLGSMAEKILQTAVIDKGELTLKKEEFDIHDILNDVIQKINIQVSIKDGEIVKDFHAQKGNVLADRVHISNMIYNLLDNSNKYSPKKPIITVSTHDTASGVAISIKDNGIGISKAYQKKIFTKLFRVPTGNVHNIKGFGLGLSYVKSIVDRHQGSITVESELEKGSVFVVIIPNNN